MRPKSIAILTLERTGGSFANLSSALAKGFHTMGVEDISLLHISEGSRLDHDLPESVSVVPLHAGHSWRAPTILARYLNSRAPDVLIAMHVFVNLAAVLGKALAWRARTRLIVSEHATISYETLEGNRRNPKFIPLRHLIRLFYPRADGLVATSQGVLRDLLTTLRVRFDPEKSSVIPNPMDVERIVRLSAEPVSHPWLDTKSIPVICCAGRLVKEKNTSLLLEAFARLLRRKKARLLILGKGPEREMLGYLARELGIANEVDFMGYVKNPYPYIAHSDVFALTSEGEAFGLVLVEAMSCGTPVVATDAKGGGPRSILGGGRFGTLVARFDAGDVADSILRILESESVRREHVRAGKERCLDYSPPVIAREWLSFMERL